MKCPNCGKGNVCYDVGRKSRSVQHKKLKKNAAKARRSHPSTSGSKDHEVPRTDFHATCKSCGWKGVI